MTKSLNLPDKWQSSRTLSAHNKEITDPDSTTITTTTGTETENITTQINKTRGIRTDILDVTDAEKKDTWQKTANQRQTRKQLPAIKHRLTWQDSGLK